MQQQDKWLWEQWARFASAAVSGVLANPVAAERSLSMEHVVQAASAHADALLKELRERCHAKTGNPEGEQIG